MTDQADGSGGQDFIELDIQGMTCDACAHHVVGALEAVDGVTGAIVPGGWSSGRATVQTAADVSPAQLTRAVAAAGYTAAVKRRRSTGRPPGGPDQPRDFDLIVIGGGSAGFAAAIRGADLGYRVALVNKGEIGGTCVNVGCVPSKTLLRALETRHLAGARRFRGVATVAGALDWAQVIAHKDALVAQMRQSRYRDVLAGYPDITYLEGGARLTGGRGVAVDGRVYQAGKIVLATGSRPWAPPVPGLEHSDYLTSDTAMARPDLPRSLIVLGAGAVGLEMAQLFARAGVAVTLLEMADRIAPEEDQDLSQALADVLRQEGLTVLTGFVARAVSRRHGRTQVMGVAGGREHKLEAAQLLVATGRRPHTAGLGLAEAGVDLGPRGEIRVNEHLQTSNPAVYAAGDVLGQEMFVYVAAYGGGLAAENALTGAGLVAETRNIPRVTFTDPQLASAGLTERQAHEHGYRVRVSQLPLSLVPRALAARDTRGLIKLVADADSDRLLGAHVLAAEAGEVIQTAVLALRGGLTIADLRQTLFPYLTQVEGLRLAALAFDRDPALLCCCAG